MKLGQVLSDYCYANRLSVRDFAKEVGLSPATAHRLCHGENVDSGTICAVVAWLFSDAKEKRQKPERRIGLGPTAALKAAQARASESGVNILGEKS